MKFSIQVSAGEKDVRVGGAMAAITTDVQPASVKCEGSGEMFKDLTITEGRAICPFCRTAQLAEPVGGETLMVEHYLLLE